MSRVTRTPTEGLGNSSYLLTHDGTGILVDPQRGPHRFESLIVGVRTQSGTFSLVTSPFLGRFTR